MPNIDLTKQITAEAKAAAELAETRAGMTCYRRAFMLALMQFQDPNGVHAHMLEALDTMLAAAGPYDPIKMAVRDVTIFSRSHPDMEAFGLSLGLTDAQMDDIFTAAMQIENGAT